MNIVINTAGLNQFFALPAGEMFWVFFYNVGWLIWAFIFLFGVRDVYLFWLRLKWEHTHQHLLLAIDIPRGNEQSPKAVENMFTYLAGAHATINFFEKWFEGKFQKPFSCEIVSLEGYTQFLIWTPVEFRNLVESAVYSQYPDAEISEVDDYTAALPRRLPDEEYDLWGTEFYQKDSEVYPIKGYQEFEHMIGPSETQFKDPMASLMDLCGSLRQGEYLWFQVIVIPMGFDWVKESVAEINKIFGRKGKHKTSLATKSVTALGELSEVVYSIWGDIEGGEKKEDKPKTMMDLTPDEKRKVEGIQLKASKIGFEAKFRTVYIAKREVMNKSKVANGLVGYMKQFASLDLNNLKPDVDLTMTKAQYFFAKRRLEEKKRKIYHAYRVRSEGRGLRSGIYNVEELATVWHFPVEANVKAAMIQKAPGRKADAPAALPLAESVAEHLPDIFKKTNGRGGAEKSSVPGAAGNYGRGAKTAAAKTAAMAEDLVAPHSAPPANLPFV
jgi:hypothetical protein